MDDFERLNETVINCRRCERLVAWRERVAREKVARFQDWEYWARPVPGFGDRAARVVVVGLAPAAHGANRTGRIFTGDRSGDWLFASLYRTGFASQPQSVHRDDGLQLRDAYVTASVRCPPPANRPTVEEREHCLPYLRREIQLLDRARVYVALGAFAAAVLSREFALTPRPRFTHGAEAPLRDGAGTLLCSYHPSQQNTFTGVLTEEMLDAVFRRARQLAGGET